MEARLVVRGVIDAGFALPRDADRRSALLLSHALARFDCAQLRRAVPAGGLGFKPPEDFLEDWRSLGT